MDWYKWNPNKLDFMMIFVVYFVIVVNFTIEKNILWRINDNISKLNKYHTHVLDLLNSNMFLFINIDFLLFQSL